MPQSRRAAQPKKIFVKHVFGGGWATDYGPSAPATIDLSGKVVLPWLNQADNVMYELDGGPHKCLGCTADTSALESGADIMGIFDAWFSGTAGTPVQHRILHVGTKVKKDNADNTFTDLFTGQTAGAVPSYCMFEDLLIVSNDSGSDVPKSWDLTTAQSLAGTPPTFSTCRVHKNRAWAFGAIANPSRLYYSVSLTGADWAGAGSGSIDIDPADGDVIKGIVSHRNDLWVFKGPNKGSIHRITGSAPTGTDAFARITFAKGVGSVNQASITAYANDVAFMWRDGSVRTLSATNNFGDFEMTSLTREITTWLRDHLNVNALRFAQAVAWPAYSLILFALPIDASTSNNIILAMDYRFDPPRWSPWVSYNQTTSLGSAISLATNKALTVLAGGTDGKLRTLGSSTRTIDTSTSISYNVKTPFVDYDLPSHMKTIEGGSLTLNPKTSGNVTFGWQRDFAAQQTIAFSQGGTSVLDSFLLDTDLLGGGQFYNAFFRCNEEGGEFRAIQYNVADNVAGQDIELHAISALITIGAESFEA